MKRNQQTIKTAHRKGGKRSKYAAKKEAGNQMYGPGCCAHSVRVPYWNG